MTVAEYLTACGGQLTPAPVVTSGLPTAVQLGLTVRDHFAAAAMQGLLANRDFHAFDEEGADLNDDLLAANAYRVADAMLAERKKLLDVPTH